MKIRVIEDTSTEALYGTYSNVLTNVDVTASAKHYLEMMAEAIRVKYPGAEVVVEGCENGHVRQQIDIDGLADWQEESEPICEDIADIRYTLRGAWYWVIYTGDGKRANG